ncbi:hypothetical protein HHI36_019849 [Cryptolaemus montrouzieri]|uniref:Uncharacterized protein n=1 Tax=Cryptolaemus montrouzieri TaxID=559131 RepID=A0ABD2N8Z0_9CUCU
MVKYSNTITDLPVYQSEEQNSTVLYFNAQSIRNKSVVFLLEVIKQDAKVVAENWLESGEECFFEFRGYNSLYASRPKQGGGAGIIVKENYEFREMSRLQENCSMLFVHIKEVNSTIGGI